MKTKIKELKEQAQKLIDLGNSKEKAKGYGMMKVIEEWEKFPFMEHLKPMICKMIENKIVIDIANNLGFEFISYLYNSKGNLKSSYQDIFNKYYDEIYNEINIFEV